MSDQDDPLTKAMREAQGKKSAEEQRLRAQLQKSEQRLHEVMRTLKEQVQAALGSIPFFDAGVSESRAPHITNSSNSAMDHFAIKASRSDPHYQATVDVCVYYDYGAPPSIGTYSVHPQGQLDLRTTGTVYRAFKVPVRVEQDGALMLDAAQMIASLAEAVTDLESGGGSSPYGGL